MTSGRRNTSVDKGGPRGSLVIAGTGIRAVRHTTPEARDEISRAEKLYYLLADVVSERWVQTLNPAAESLAPCYVRGKSRMVAYRKMISKMLGSVRGGFRVCAVFYGHPGVFVYPSHEAIRIARREGYEARMLPGISAEDCLFADLGLDPARSGCQSFEATDFLMFRRRFDPSSSLLLWQAGVVGSFVYRPRGTRPGLRALAQYLAGFYGGGHRVVLYEASPLPLFEPIIRSTTIEELPKTEVDDAMTLFVPPKPRRPDPDGLKQLGLARTKLTIIPPCWQPDVSRAVPPPESRPRRRRTGPRVLGS